MSDSKFWDKARGRVRAVGSESAEQFWDKARAVAAKATRAYLATAKGDQPKVYFVHPAFEGERIWVATGRTSAKARHIDRNPKVELFYQVGPDWVHLTVTGRAKFMEGCR